MTDDLPEDTARPPGHVPNWFVATTMIVALALVASLGVIFFGARDLKQASDQEERRQDAISAASDFMVQLNTYDVADLTDYQSRVDPLLTPDFRQQFDSATGELFPKITETQLATSGQVLRAAVADIDGDSAQVLVVADATAKTPQQSRIRHFRWSVELQQDGGQWRVSNYEALQAGGAIPGL